MKQLTCGSLFSGIGGMDLGLERAGFEIKWQVEKDEYCRRILERRFPSAKRCSDIRSSRSGSLSSVDLIAAGPPCQPSSRAGRQEFSEDDRWLWGETFRVLRDLRPRYILLENPTGLLDGPIGNIFGELAEMGLDAEWLTVSASRFGFPHQRERIVIIAYPPSVGQQGPWALGHEIHPTPDAYWEATDVVDAFQREALPFVCGGHYGFPKGLDQAALTALGNAVVPQIAEWIGKRILSAEEKLTEKP